MSDSDGDSEEYIFQSTVDFDANQEEQERNISNDHNFKTLTEICNTFYDDLQKNDFFGHKLSWRTSTSIDPIKLTISSQETLPGICDIIKPSKLMKKLKFRECFRLLVKYLIKLINC